MSGSCEEFILAHAESGWAAGSLYYLGNFFLILQKHDRAEEVYEAVLDNFEETDYFEPAYYKYFHVAAESKRKETAIERGEDFLEELPDSPKADIVKKRIEMLKKF